MKRIIKKTDISSKEYAELAMYCNSNNLMIFIDDDNYYILERYETVKDGEIIFNRDKLLREEKDKMLMKIEEYDKSDKVNVFYLNNEKLWLDKNTRIGLRTNVEDARRLGMENISWVFNGKKITVSIASASMMLAKLETEYARECYIVTELHKSAVENAESVDDLKNIDITKDYPDILHFEI